MAAQSDSENAAPTESTIRILDQAYESFPPFSEWSKVELDTTRWGRYSKHITDIREATPEQLHLARRIAIRAAAIDTGAIEGLYEVDRGFTFTVAVEAAEWEALLSKKGEEAHSLIESQLTAYEYLVDFATNAAPISEASIRTLHQELVAAQHTYRVLTPLGFQERPLPKGQFKDMPNHVRRRDGKMHSYAPVDETPAEMYRLVNDLRSDEFLGSHPILQASFAHYAFVVIHPFADGNGRVARALASIFLYRAQSIPLLVLSEQKAGYLSALESADNGDFRPFVEFTMDRALDAMQLVAESVSAAIVPSADDSLKRIHAMYVTKGGYTHAQVDQAAISLLTTLSTELRQKNPRSQLGRIDTKRLGFVDVLRSSNVKL